MQDSKNRLAEIKVPTLVIAGDSDFALPEQLYCETAAGIPNARLILYGGVDHFALGNKHFGEDILEFSSDNKND